MKVLWIGDAVVQSGFARVTHNIVGRLKTQHKCDVRVLGVNYNGDPHPYDYPIYPALIGGDPWGIQRVPGVVRDFQPDVICINNDPWNVAQYLSVIRTAVPTTAYMPVDAPNQMHAGELSVMPRAIAYTNFGKKELLLGGYNGRVDVIPHGVDTEIYKPVEDRVTARKWLEFQPKLTDEQIGNLFIVSNVNRNQPRKRLDLTIQYFTQFWLNIGQPSHVRLHLHCGEHDMGWNVSQLAKYFGINKQLIITTPKMSLQACIKEHELRLVYGMADVNLSTTLGEGWGLTTHESMACGIPQIVPRYSALGEWPDGAVRYVECTSFQATHNAVNTIGGVADMAQTVEALTDLYRNADLRTKLGSAALARATEERFKWDKIAAQFYVALAETFNERRAAPVGVEAPRSNG
jgi:glycosyltransferase involved in cell wall biosynthesis